MRVRPTHYTIETYFLKSWVVEGLLDDENWTEIDQQANNQDFKDGWNTVSSTVSKSVESRFIRLSPTDKNHNGSDSQVLAPPSFAQTLDIQTTLPRLPFRNSNPVERRFIRLTHTNNTRDKPKPPLLISVGVEFSWTLSESKFRSLSSLIHSVNLSGFEIGAPSSSTDCA
jgi:hypothetical protein